LPFQGVDAHPLLLELLPHGLHGFDELRLLRRRRHTGHDEAEADRAG
jgi:hypothetical protein